MMIMLLLRLAGILTLLATLLSGIRSDKI